MFKGNVRSDWIWMRVVPLDRPWKGHQPLQVFDFLISVLNIWKEFKVLSHFIQKIIKPPACSITVCIESFLPIGWCTFISWKNPPKGCWYIWFGLQDVGILQIFYSRAVIQRTIVGFPAFWSTIGRKNRGLCPYKSWSEQAGGWIHLCMKRLRPLKCFQKFKTEIQKSKTHSGW